MMKFIATVALAAFVTSLIPAPVAKADDSGSGKIVVVVKVPSDQGRGERD